MGKRKKRKGAGKPVSLKNRKEKGGGEWEAGGGAESMHGGLAEGKVRGGGEDSVVLGRNQKEEKGKGEGYGRKKRNSRKVSGAPLRNKENGASINSEKKGRALKEKKKGGWMTMKQVNSFRGGDPRRPRKSVSQPSGEIKEKN